MNIPRHRTAEREPDNGVAILDQVITWKRDELSRLDREWSSHNLTLERVRVDLDSLTADITVVRAELDAAIRMREVLTTPRAEPSTEIHHHYTVPTTQETERARAVMLAAPGGIIPAGTPVIFKQDAAEIADEKAGEAFRRALAVPEQLWGISVDGTIDGKKPYGWLMVRTKLFKKDLDAVVKVWNEMTDSDWQAFAAQDWRAIAGIEIVHFVPAQS